MGKATKFKKGEGWAKPPFMEKAKSHAMHPHGGWLLTAPVRWVATKIGYFREPDEMKPGSSKPETGVGSTVGHSFLVGHRIVDVKT